jgi:tetratricopeptide (TPR) repeat protein
LAELTRTHLVAEPIPGRFAFHDLLRAYATELAHSHDSDNERSMALHRVLDHHLHTAHTAALLMEPNRDAITPAPAQAGVTPEHFSGHGHALAWFTIEHPVLLALIQRAADTGFDTQAWQLAWTLTDYFDRRGHWYDWTATQRTALDATQRLADRRGQAFAHRSLARVCCRLARYGDADTHLKYALDLYSALGDQIGQAQTHNNLGGVLDRQGRHREALSHAQRALDLSRAAADLAGEADALGNIGWSYAQLCDHEQALTRCQQALDLHMKLGDLEGQASNWDSLGVVHSHLGRHHQAITSYQHALDLFRDLGDRYNEADVLAHLGDTHHASGDLDAARFAWQHALVIFDQLGHPDADLVRAKLQ